ncbi:MAG TPA: hypothetical protein PK245_00240 [Clostridia bacterium]|jgi:hypothetical protein|nr:hypothetical protein [Clostridia bacterium]HRU84768.1 hypothetical protein [Eubacteriales bacterium]
MADVWQNIKDFFKSRQKLEEEKNQKIKKALEDEAEAVEKLKKLEEAYLATLPKEAEVDLDKLFPETLGLKTVEYLKKSDDELKQQAESELLPLLEAKKTSEKVKAESASETLENKKESEQSDYEAALKKINEAYLALQKKIKDSAVRRGMARSSAMENDLGGAAEAAQSAESAAEGGYRAAIDEIDGKIESLSKDLQGALEELDLSYASKIAERLSGLQNEREAAEAAAIKHNNAVTEKELKYQKEREEDIAEYLKRLDKNKLEAEKARAEYEKKYGYDAEKQKNYAERYKIAYDYYMSLSKDIAAEALAASPNMRYYLGNYYDTLMKILSDRADKKKTYY